LISFFPSQVHLRNSICHASAGLPIVGTDHDWL
jgi:hypothetical protein